MHACVDALYVFVQFMAWALLAELLNAEGQVFESVIQHLSRGSRPSYPSWVFELCSWIQHLPQAVVQGATQICTCISQNGLMPEHLRAAAQSTYGCVCQVSWACACCSAR